jgi:hypothetical protein
MEGYSVTEAASVLGVPTERVWELLARGVLSGAPEGETGMRVYLQPRPPPAPPEPTRTNGNGGTNEPERELSPFRALLTEFRSLTERYGQALLALGEARGEVAALRSRVDLLEARMDLRLPAGPPASPAAWAATPMPFPAERAVVPTAPTEGLRDEAEPHPDEHDPEEHRRARRRGPRRATEEFAEALARAEDPSPPELPGGTEAAAAMASLRTSSEGSTDAAATEADLPRELPAADAVPVADEADAILTEPVEAETPPEAEAATEAEIVAEPEPVEAEAPPEAEAATEAEIVAEPAPEPQPEPAEPGLAEAVPLAEAEPAAEELELEVAIEPEPVVAAAEPDTTEPHEWDSERYTTDIDEPDWFAAEVIEPELATSAEARAPESEEAQGEMASVESVDEEPVSEPGMPAPEAMEAAPEADAPEADVATADVTGFDEPASRTDEETMLWFGRSPDDASGASEMEVATSGRRTSDEVSQPEPKMPGASDLDQALAALRAVAGRGDEPPEQAAEPPEQGASEPEDAEADEWPPRPVTVGEAVPGQQPSQATPTFAPGGASTTSPASRAYRRLRRIFPG